MNLKRLKISISVFISAAFVLSISHHTVNFWELEILKEAAVVLTAVPILALPVFLLLNRIWDLCAAIEKKRWLLFLFPALIVAAVFGWQYYTSPSVWHVIKIVPAAGQTGQIELHEIKYPPGRTVKFSNMAKTKGWKIEDDILKTVGAEPASLEYSFFSPIGETTSLLFQRSPASSDVTVILDGKQLDVKLRHPDAGQTPVEITTAYKMGIPAWVILAVIMVSDFLSFFLLILFAWVVQEISQLKPATQASRERFLSHRAGILVLVSIVVLFHVVNFLAAPLVIGPDSPSFMVGAIHWVQYHNLDGVLPGRGVITTLLFIPAFLIFGRDPWGVKLALHLLAVGCVPLMYYLGWNLYKRRALAFFAGLIAVLMPEMYLYANIVMSDLPNMFLVIAFCAFLLTALERFSWRNAITSLLVGSVAALHRPENIMLLAIAAGFFFIKIVWEKEDTFKRFQILGAAILIAAIPLLAWAAHNKRVSGFFGLFDYGTAGAIWYDGWIYYGEASGIHITDQNSPSVQIIAKAISVYDQPINSVVAPTSGELYPVMEAYGYPKPEARVVFSNAAKDSIRSNPKLALELYMVKIRKSFVPEYIMTITFPIHAIPANAAPLDETAQWQADHFDKERNIAPALIPLQRKAYDLLAGADYYIYRPLVLFSLCIAVLAVYQKDFFKWMPMVVITASRLVITITIGLGIWRYLLTGIVILMVFSLLAVQIVQGFFSALILNPKPE